MIPQPVAPAHKPSSTPHPLPMPDFGVNFAQLVGGGAAPSKPAATSEVETLPPSHEKSKNASNDAAMIAATAGAAPAKHPAPIVQAITTTTTADGVSEVAPPTPTVAKGATLTTPGVAAAAASLPVPDPSGGTNSTDTTSATNPNGKTAAATATPPGAAELNARVVAAVPSFLSQPSATLAGLWHHTGGDVGSVASETAKGSTATDAPVASATGPAAAANTGSNVPPNLANAVAAQIQSHPAAPGVAAVFAASSSGTGASSQQGSTATMAGAAIAAAAPATVATQTPIPTPAAANPVLPPPMLGPAAEQVAINLRQAVQTGTNRIEIQLKPASLGAIDVKLDLTHDGRISVIISADRSDTLNLLRQDSAGLQQALRNAGLQADSGSLSFNLRGDAQSFAQNSPPTPAPFTTRTITSSDTGMMPTAQLLANATRAHRGPLNIEV